MRKAIRALRSRDSGRTRTAERTIDQAVGRFFENLPKRYAPGVLDAMRLLDEIAMRGVHFDAPLFLFRKSLFTLDGVVQDIAGQEVRMDQVIVRHFLTRWAASFGLFYSPLGMRGFYCRWSGTRFFFYPARSWGRRVSSAPVQTHRDAEAKAVHLGPVRK